MNGRIPDGFEPIDIEEDEVSARYGSIEGNSSTLMTKLLAGLAVALTAGAIGFAYGRIFDHESRISSLEAVEKYKEQQEHRPAVYRGSADVTPVVPSTP